MKRLKTRKFRIKKRVVGAVVLLLAIAGAAVFGLVACGDMSEADVVSKLTSNLEESKGYLATGMMEVESEGQVHTYLIEVAFAQPEYYRVTMRNEATGNEQVILKNDDGVFVLTPALNKQFKFQSEWPLTSSQVYLYQSLLMDILSAETTVFEVLEEGYVFTIGATYHANGDLVEQVMHFERKGLTPTLIEVRDSEGVARMTMQFNDFEWNPTFDENAFVAEAIMEVAQDVLGEGVISVANVEEELLYPTYLPGDSQLIDKTTVSTAHGERVIMSFAGDHEFTIIQESARVREVFAPEHVMGEPVMVNGTVGAISDNTLTWQRGGVEFFLVSNTLDRHELITIASSITEAYEK
ncbi:MAG: outer membrane lipoprotein carrier protein LolA [Turicibacter sp.]|nr:outer membrane lipoprotein carrier protein LolA [Turicibacter sp.]